MISDLYTLCNTVNRYVLRIVTINMIFIGMSDSLILLITKKIKKDALNLRGGGKFPAVRVRNLSSIGREHGGLIHQ
jgi:hypothetical protein